MDKVIDEKEFIQNFALELTNRTLEQRKEIGKKYYKQLQRAKAEIEELKKQVKNNETAYHTELGTYNMECGNLLEENKNLIEENERLKEEKGGMQILIDNYIALTEKYRQALQEIREMATLFHSVNENKGLDRFKNNIIDKINSVIGAE